MKGPKSFPSAGLSDQFSRLTARLSDLGNNIGDFERQREIQKLVRALLRGWQQLLLQEMELRSEDYLAISSELRKANKAARGALADVHRLGAAINAAAKVLALVAKAAKIRMKL